MKRIELRLIPTPGQKPEFLATLELVQKTPIPTLWEQFPAVLVLEGYTRDPWVLDTSTPHWIKWQVESVDGRNKLPGFIKYLVDRQKTAYGRVVVMRNENDDNNNNNKNGGDSYAWVIPPKQMSSTAINCRIAPLQHIPNCPLKPISTVAKSAPTTTSSSSVPSSETAKNGTSAPTVTAATSTKPKKSGLLGNLVGAQRRTNQQVQIATAVAPKKVPPPPAAASSSSSGTDPSDPSSTSTHPTTSLHQPSQQDMMVVGTKTAGQVLAEFRQEMEQEMLDFDISSEAVLKIKIDLPAKLRLLTDDEKQNGRVTMEVLKYIVYEQAEEVNEEWIAHKEPSEFMDEAVIAIYKEGEAPPEVLEEINKGELPDEVRGQQRAIVEQRQKAELIKAQKLQMEQTRLALQNKAKTKQGGGGDGGEDDDDNDEEDDDLAALNTNKRDRRTIEDFEREAKRRRGE